MTAPRVLVYYPDADTARAYAAAIDLPRRSLDLRVAWTPARAAPLVGETEVLFGWGFPAPLLARAPRLRWIQAMGAGVERFLVPELGSRVVLTRAAGIFGPWMAEYTVGWCLWVTQRVAQFRADQQARRWAPVDTLKLRGTTLCIVGLGDIGRHIARAARCLGMRVIGVSRAGRPLSGVERIYRPPGMRAALARADFVVLTLPLSEKTRGLIGARELAAMKPSAWLINIARGPIVDERALLASLRARRIAGAVLDVFDTEPLPSRHPFWRLDNVVVTPHISGPSTPDEIAPIFGENLRRYLTGRPLRHVVDRARGY